MSEFVNGWGPLSATGTPNSADQASLPDRVAVPPAHDVASFGEDHRGGAFPRGWFGTSRVWIAEHFARTPIMRSSIANSPPEKLAPAAGIASKVVTVHLHNGKEFVVAVDAKNEAYLYSCLNGSNDTARVAWFETVDGCFVGLNIAQINAVFWHVVGPTMQNSTAWDRSLLMVHFADKENIALEQVSGEEIARLRGASMSKHRFTQFHTLHGRGEDVSINIETITHVTMPLAWLD